MSAASPEPGDHPAVAPDLRDPQHDPTASYALDQAFARRLTGLVTATGDESRPSTSPYNLAPLAMVPQSTPGDVESAFRRARRAQQSWAATPIRERQDLLMRYHDLVMDHRDELADLVVLESGKSRKDAFTEVMHVALTARYYSRTGARHLAPHRRGGVLPLLTRLDVDFVPKGVVGVISPWNYPLTMALSDGLAALMAGNAVVAKPDAQTILTALLGVQLLREAGFPEDLWHVLAGPGPVIGPEIVRRADYICFTGSTATGKLIARQCADRLIGCSLELGGKNPMIVLRDADVDKAAEGAVRGAFSNAGQLCVSMERLFVADQVYDRFLRRFVERTEAMNLGDPAEWSTDMGTLISQSQLDTVTAHVADAVAKGASLLTGGRPRPDLGPYFFEPTILSGVTPDMTCFGNETFGPVISVYRFHDEGEAVARANEGPYGLNGSIYSQDGARARELARLVRCGTVNVNETFAPSFGSIAAPMGGMRESGMGRRQGPEGILRFTDVQAVASQRVIPIGPSHGLSEEQWAKLMVLQEKIQTKLRRP